MVAAALEDVIAGDRVQEFMMEAEGINKSLGAKIKKFFQDICDLFKEILDVYKNVRSDTPEASIIHKMDDIYQKLQRALVRGVYDAGKNFQNAENTTGEGGVRYSISKTSKMPYVNQLELIEKGKMNGSNSLYIGKPLDKLQSAGFSDAPLAMNQGDYRKARRESAKNKNYSSHAVPYDFFKKMPHHIGNAPMLIDNGTKVSVVTPYGMKDTKGNDSFVIAGVWRNQQMESDVVNLVKSAYPLDDFNDRIKRAAEEGKLVVVNKNKAEEMLATIGIQPAEVSRILNLAKSSLSQPETVVKQISSTDSDGNQLSAGQIDFFKDSKVRDENGNLLVVYHGTPNGRTTIFDASKTSKDNNMGQGIYFSTAKSDASEYMGKSRNKKLYSVYVNIVHPFVISKNEKITISEAVSLLKLCDDRITARDVYQELLINAKDGYITTDQFANTNIAIHMTEMLAKSNKYDGIIDETVSDKFGLRKDVRHVIVLKSNQIKSVDNKNPTDNPDIRYSVGRKTDRAVQEVLEKENAQLREDVAKLKELVKLQGQETGGTKFLETSVLAAARYIKKLSGSKANTNELSGMLNDFYEYIATNKELTWEDVREQAQPIAQWLMDRVEHTRSDYAQEVLDQMKGGKVYLDETQMKEAEHLFGSYNDFRKSVQGAMVISKSANMSLDVWWQEMSTLYSDVFAVDATASDMVRQLADIVNSLKNENSSALEYAYNRKWIEQDLIRDIYDSYWRVSNLRTVADRYAAKHNKLVIEHNERINRLKADNREKIEQLKEPH